MPPAHSRKSVRASAQFKLELTGHTSMVFLSLLGVCLYTLTYSLVYYGGKPRAVPVLELWMVFSQLYVACGCCGVQLAAAVFMGLPEGVARAGDVQASAFLGIALAVTCVSIGCMGGGLECAVFFPSAMAPPIAAAGAVAWAWVAYAACLGCQSALGLGGRSGLLTALCLGCAVPPALAALQRTCAPVVGEDPSWAAALEGVSGSVASNNAWLLFGALLLGEGASAISTAAMRQPAQGFVAAGAALVGALLVCVDAGFIYVGGPVLGSPNLRVCMVLLSLLPLASHARALLLSTPSPHQQQQQHQHLHTAGRTFAMPPQQQQYSPALLTAKRAV